ncbi:MAG: peptidoglycan binding domain-containing protein, partial [Raoultibacter sp.]
MGIGRVLKAIIFGIGHFFAVALTWISRSKIAIFATVAVLVFVAIGLVDLGVNWGKVYPGVKIGEVDLSGKTADEAALLINTAYADRLAEKEVLIFANEEASTNIEQTIANNQNNALAEQQTVEEALANKTLWTATATSLSAQLDTEAMTQEALSVGREDGGIFERFSAMAFGHVIYPRATYDGEALEHLAVEIDAAIGIPRINFNIRMYADKAWVTDGRDGDMLNRDDFKNLLDSSFLAADGNQASFVAKTEYAPIQITREEAERTAAFVNETIVQGATFPYGDTEWTATAADIGAWIKTRVLEEDDGYKLEPYLDQTVAKGIMLNHLKTNFDGDTMKVAFEVTDDGQQVVHTDTEETIPLVGEAVSTL